MNSYLYGILVKHNLCQDSGNNTSLRVLLIGNFNTDPFLVKIVSTNFIVCVQRILFSLTNREEIERVSVLSTIGTARHVSMQN